MSGCKSFEDLKDCFVKTVAIDHALSDAYSKHERDGKKETLREHSELCLSYFLAIASKRNLDEVYDNLILSLGLEVAFIKTKLLEAAYYHDIGKLNPQFQEFCNGKEVSRKDRQHARYSYYTQLILNQETITKASEYDLTAFLIATIFKCVFYHHSSLKNFDFDFLKTDLNKMKKDRTFIGIFTKTGLQENCLVEYKREKVIKSLPQAIFYLIKLFYSHLVLSDYYSTSHFSHNTHIDINVIDDTLLKNIERSFEMFQKKYGSAGKTAKEVGQCTSLNDCRQNLLVQSHNRMVELLKGNDRIFMLNVPTGGGKTNISLRLALDILKARKQVNKVFWVFPYINIIEQNYEVIKTTLFNGKNDDEVDNFLSKNHSSKIDKSADMASDEDIENSLLDDYKMYLDDLYLNSPITIMTNVNFFDSFIKAGGNNRHKAALLTNSVVIIDEVQTLKVENLNFFYSLMDELSKRYNIYFIVMSATLPDFNEFIDEKIQHIIENYEDYFKSSFFKRNHFNFTGDCDLQSLTKEINSIMQSENKKLLVCVNTIRTSIELFNELEKTGREIFLLNSLTPPADRVEIIKHIKESREKSILISTQAIEAGVDISFDIAIRDYAPLDSIEQIAGRVNRESDQEKASKSEVRVMRYKNGSAYDYKKVYQSIKLKIQEKDYLFQKKNVYQNILKILEEKDFKSYYEELAAALEEGESKKEALKGLMSNMRLLEYESLSKNVEVFDDISKEQFYIEFPIKESPELNSVLSQIEKISEKKDFVNKICAKNHDSIDFDLNSLISFRDQIVKKAGFLYKPLNKKINAILSMFGVSIFAYSGNEILANLKQLGYVSENNVATTSFKEEFLKSYEVSDRTYYSVDIPRLINRIKEARDESIII